ncbi:unnamed protein product [Lupinus luteus]|uniref:mannan endo-1,4-beta-mannosidase n=1 Tax=Lupinus luteus TaxID=3873 RepID=A0AAV1WYY3_LUPLU
MVAASDKSQRSKVSNVLAQASAAGLKGLDFVVSEAGKYNIKLIISLVNNFKDLGGKVQYVQWARHAGVKIKNPDDFYTNAVVRGYYRNHVKKVLTRVNTITKIAYKDDPIIMAWQLMNEPRSAPQYAKSLHKWIEEMAAYVKSIDNKHLLSIGMEGFYGEETPDRKQYNPGNYTSGTEFVKNHLVKEIDFATMHVYPDRWLSTKIETERRRFLQRWIDIHFKDSMTIVKKPLVLAEFGRVIVGNNVKYRDSFMNEVYSYIYAFAKISRGGMAGSLVWQLMSEDIDVEK